MSAAEAQTALEHDQDAEYRDYRRKALVSVTLGVVAMLVSMPLMGGSGHGAMDPVMRLADRFLSAPLARSGPRSTAPTPGFRCAGACSS
ncbi:MAG: hypothetical protein R2882_05715 [Gemmatimonadales bacterium]